MEQLSGLDTMFLHAELHGLPMHISSFSIYDPSSSKSKTVSFKEVLDVFQHKVQQEVPVLRSKLIEVPMNLDQPYWIEDSKFDLVYHVRHIALPAPGDWDKLYTLIANLHARPLNRARPLWEAYVIDGLGSLEGVPEGAFGLFLKVHHAIMDGRTGLAIYSNLHTLSPDEGLGNVGDVIPKEEERKTYKPPSGYTELLAKSYVNNVKKAGKLAKTASQLAKSYGKIQLGLKSNELHSLDKVRCRFNGVIEPGRVVDRVCLPIESVKEIRKSLPEVTINDVALAIVGGAMRKYLQAKDELPDIPLVAGVPIDVRTAADEDIKGNMVSIMNVGLKTNIDDPYERLKWVRKEAQASKKYSETLGRRVVNDVLDSLWPGLTSFGIRKMVESGALFMLPPVHNTIVTNVPGAPLPIYLAGAKMIDSFGMGPLVPGVGLFHTVTSTYQQLIIAFTACRKMMPDPAFYAECLQEAYDELYVAAKSEIKRREKKKMSRETTLKKANQREKVRPKKLSAKSSDKIADDELLKKASSLRVVQKKE